MNSKKEKIFCVKYTNHCKKISNPDEANIRKAFKIDQSKVIFAQYYDKDFSTYMDIEWSEIMAADSVELKIVDEICCGEPQSRPTSESPKANISRSDTVLVEEMDPLIREDLFGCSPKEGNSQISRQDAIKGLPVCDLEFCTIEVTEDINEPSTSTSTASTSLKRKKINPKVRTSPRKNPKVRTSPRKNPKVTYECHATSYVLPEIAENSRLGVALKQKQPLNKGLKSHFLTKIFDDFASKKKFYEEIVHAILNTYPYLGAALPYESAKHLWLKSLNAKFCNERKRPDYKEDISQCKNKRMSQKSFNVVAEEGSSMFGIPYYHPRVTLDGEDDQISVNSHKKWMEHEVNLADRNMSGITSRMKITFIDRRNLLFANECGAPTSNLAGDILKEYPCLGIEDQAIGEIQRLFGGESNVKFENYIARFVSFSKKLHEAVCNSKSKYKSFMNELFCSGNSDNYENLIMHKCLGYISVLLLENPENVISKSLNQTHAPMLMVTMEEDVNVAVDGTVFIHSVSPKNSVFLWLSAFFIFNIRPIKNLRTFDVLQHLLFNIPEKPKLNQAALKIVDYWNSSH